jgi:hypothetical protein
MITEMAVGLVNQAILAGSSDTELYQKRVFRDVRKAGGYQIQTPPHDIAAMVNHARHALKGKRMLCIGSETLGAERFIAEQLGMLSMDILYASEGKPSSDNATTLIRDGIRVNGSGKPEGIYDLIFLTGDNDFNLTRILFEHSKVDTLVCTPNINVKMAQGGLREAWFYLRAKHFAVLQTPHTDWDGCGMARITHKEELTHEQIEKAHKLPIFTKRNDGSVRESGNQSKAEQPIESSHSQRPEGLGDSGETGGSSGQREVGEAQAVSGTPETPQVQEGPEQEVAPWGRKKNGEPKARPGRPVVA